MRRATRRWRVEELLDEVEAIADGARGDPYQLLIDSINPKHRGDEHGKLAVDAARRAAGLRTVKPRTPTSSDTSFSVTPA